MLRQTGQILHKSSHLKLKELLVSLLRAPELEVVTAAAAAVARMATEDETLAVLSDHHVVTLLASLVRSVSAVRNFIPKSTLTWLY